MITALVLTLLVNYVSVDSPESNETVVYFDRMQINEVYDPETGNHRLDQLVFEDWLSMLCPVENVPGLYRPKHRFVVEHWVMLPDAARDKLDAEDKKKWEAALAKYLSRLSLQDRAMVSPKYKYPGKYDNSHFMHPKKTKDGFYTVRVPKGWRNPSPASIAGDVTAGVTVVKAKFLIHTKTLYDPEVVCKREFPNWERRLFVRPKVGPHIWQR